MALLLAWADRALNLGSRLAEGREGGILTVGRFAMCDVQEWTTTRMARLTKAIDFVDNPEGIFLQHNALDQLIIDVRPHSNASCTSPCLQAPPPQLSGANGIERRWGR